MNKHYVYVFLICLWAIPQILRAQVGESGFYGAAASAMAGSAVHAQDAYSLFGNQAGLASLQSWEAFAATERRFALQALSTTIAGVALPTRSGTFGVALQYYGFESYNEQKVGLAYGRKLFERLQIGAQVNLYNFSIAEYGNKTTLSFEGGMQSTLVKGITFSAHIISPIQTTLAENQRLATLFRLGGKYTPNSKVAIVAEVEKSAHLKPTYRGGLAYQLIPALSLRLGVAANPTLFAFGIGYHVKGLRIDLGSSYHPILGFSPSIGIGYAGVAKKKS